jgi:hypothetical protein
MSQFAGDSYFGVCPHCLHTDGYTNIGPNHLGVCDTHQVYWYIGSNLFSSWKDENEEIWAANRKHIENYGRVQAFYGPEISSESS